MKKIRWLLFLSLCSLLFVAIGCNNDLGADPSTLTVSKQFFKLNTFNTITLYGTDDSSLIDQGIREVERLENMLSVHIPTSELAEIKNNAGVQPIPVSKETFEVVQRSIHFAKLSDGLFDISIGPIVSLWGFDTTEGSVPSQHELDTVLPLVNYQHISMNETDQTIFLEKEGMSLDLGAIAKGYIADKAAEKLVSLGVDRAILNFGGNVVVIGEKFDGSAFNVGIRNPDETIGGIIGVLQSKNSSVVTSGDYERFIEKDGNRYHHIIDPRTGFPTDNDLTAVAIVADNSFDADAISTAVLIMGLSDGIAFVESLPKTEALFISKDHTIYVTEAIKPLFILDSNLYTMGE
jgi:thiamine biosynthesis lipoprotein